MARKAPVRHPLVEELPYPTDDVEPDHGELGTDGGRRPVTTSRRWPGPAGRRRGSSSTCSKMPTMSRSQPARSASLLQVPAARTVSHQLVVHPLQAGPEQLVAVGEVDVDRGPGHARLGGDLVHRHLGGAPLAEEPPGHVDDLVAAEVPDDLLQVLGSSARAISGRSPAGPGVKATGMCFTPLMNGRLQPLRPSRRGGCRASGRAGART